LDPGVFHVGDGSLEAVAGSDELGLRLLEFGLAILEFGQGTQPFDVEGLLTLVLTQGDGVVDFGRFEGGAVSLITQLGLEERVLGAGQGSFAGFF
jgi:hypothetical protein